MGPLPPPQVRLCRGFPRLTLQKAGIAVNHVHVEHMFHGGMKTEVKGQHPHLPPPAAGVHSLEGARKRRQLWGFPSGSVVKNPPANERNMGSIPAPGRSHMPRSK